MFPAKLRPELNVTFESGSVTSKSAQSDVSGRVRMQGQETYKTAT